MFENYVGISHHLNMRMDVTTPDYLDLKIIEIIFFLTVARLRSSLVRGDLAFSGYLGLKII